MQSGIAPCPGSTTRAARRMTAGIGGDLDRALGRDMLQRLGNRAQVAHAVVDDGDVGHRRFDRLRSGNQLRLSTG